MYPSPSPPKDNVLQNCTLSQPGKGYWSKQYMHLPLKKTMIITDCSICIIENSFDTEEIG